MNGLEGWGDGENSPVWQMTGEEAVSGRLKVIFTGAHKEPRLYSRVSAF